MKKLVLIALTALVAHPALASVSIECGKGLNAQDGTLKESEMLVSSEDDNFTGPEGKNWVAFGSENTELKKATITKEANGDLTLVTMIDTSARVGISYTIKASKDSQTTTAEKKNIGGFAGGVKTGDLECVVTQD